LEFWRNEMKDRSLKKKRVAVMMGGLSRERESPEDRKGHPEGTHGEGIYGDRHRRGGGHCGKIGARERWNVLFWLSMEDSEKTGPSRGCWN
jgi:hypothetical protein